jgi:hypothetical protein
MPSLPRLAVACPFLTSESAGKPGILKRSARKYLTPSSQCSNPVSKNIHEVKLLFVMTIEHLTQAMVPNICSLPARLPIQAAQMD